MWDINPEQAKRINWLSHWFFKLCLSRNNADSAREEQVRYIKHPYYNRLKLNRY